MGKSMKKKSDSSDIALKVEHVSKSFRLPTEKSSGIKQAFINRMRGKTGYTKQQVLKDISFEIKKGDFFGIVGRNGSGKSTLLKLISQIYVPDSGKITVNGSLVPFIELGVGFNPELTGRENVYLNGAMLGFNKEEIDEMYGDIVEFAELHDFMDQKLKNYSSGMQVRLAFSVAIKAQGDILVLDEVLAVGDEAFQRKCFAYFAQLKKEKKTVILVTHSMDAVQQFCTKAMLIKDGDVEYVGDTARVASMYREENMHKDEVVSHKGKNIQSNNIASVSASIDSDPSDPELVFDVTITVNENIPNAVLAISLTKDNGEIVYRWASNEKMRDELLLHRGKKVDVRLHIQNIFPNGVFSLNVGLRNKDVSRFYLSADDVLKFEIVNTSHVADAYWKPNERVKIIQ